MYYLIKNDSLTRKIEMMAAGNDRETAINAAKTLIVDVLKDDSDGVKSISFDPEEGMGGVEYFDCYVAVKIFEETQIPAVEVKDIPEYTPFESKDKSLDIRENSINTFLAAIGAKVWY